MCVYCNVKDATQKGRSFSSLLKVIIFTLCNAWVKNKTEKNNTLQIWQFYTSLKQLK